MSGPIPFDTVDVTKDPAYAVMVGRPGMMNRIRWVGDPDRTRAKQINMLAIDRDMSDRWIAVMEELLARGLSDAEFTTERMLRLKLWQRERKRLQHNLHYKYDVSRRRTHLVDRDVDAQLAKMRNRLEESLDRWAQASPEEDDDESEAIDDLPAELDASEQPAASTLQGDALLARISDDTGISDPVAATDDEIAAAYFEVPLPGDVTAKAKEIGTILSGVRGIRGFEYHNDEGDN